MASVDLANQELTTKRRIFNYEDCNLLYGLIWKNSNVVCNIKHNFMMARNLKWKSYKASTDSGNDASLGLCQDNSNSNNNGNGNWGDWS